MELENGEQIMVDNAKQIVFFNTNSAFDENDTHFIQSIHTNTVSIKEEIADSVFVEEDNLLETKIKIEDYDFYHSATHFNKIFYYNEDNSIQNDLDITSKNVSSAEDIDNFFSDELKQSIKKDCASIASADCSDNCAESIDWKPVIENNFNFENFNEKVTLSEVSLDNAITESDLKEILREEKCVVERYTQKKTSAELLGITEELYVYLQQQDLYELQRTYRGNESPSKEPERGVGRQSNNTGPLKTYSLLPHLLIHKSVDKSEGTFRCGSCPFIAKSRPLIISHMLVHIPAERQSIHKCPHCDFEAKQEQYIRRHIRRMHNSEKIHEKRRLRYKCPHCPYQTDRLYALEKVHSLKHTSDEAKVHACSLCSYRAKSKAFLKKHMLIHKTPDEVVMYKCDLCPFSTKHKHRLTLHQKLHLEVSEEDRISCTLCPFKAENSKVFWYHTRTHLDPSQIAVYRCDQCPYESPYKANVKKHSIIHKKREELPSFRCNCCDYKATTKHYLQRHCKLMHTDPSEIDWKKCEKCEFKTKLLCNLKKHTIIHQQLEELEIYRCAHCSFSTKWKQKLKTHIEKHTNAHYNCLMCNFKTKHFFSLNSHKRKVHEQKSQA